MNRFTVPIGLTNAIELIFLVNLQDPFIQWNRETPIRYIDVRVSHSSTSVYQKRIIVQWQDCI